MGKVQSTLLTITAVAWTGKAACPTGTFAIDVATNAQCDGSGGVGSQADCCTDTCLIIGVTGTAAPECVEAVFDPLMEAWLTAQKAYAAQLLADEKTALTSAIATAEQNAKAYAVAQDAAQKLLWEAADSITKANAVLEAISHEKNYNQVNHDDFKQQLNVAMTANLNSAKTEADKAEKSADEAYKSAKDAAVSALESKQSAEHAKKNKADADDILTSVKKLVQGWIHTNYGGCAQPPCSSPCQYSAINPLYYYHC